MFPLGFIFRNFAALAFGDFRDQPLWAQWKPKGFDKAEPTESAENNYVSGCLHLLTLDHYYQIGQKISLRGA